MASTLGKFLRVAVLLIYIPVLFIFRAPDLIEVAAFQNPIAICSAIVGFYLFLRLAGANWGVPLAAAVFGLYTDLVFLTPLEEGVRLPEGSIVVITGANSGIGLAAAKALAPLGAASIILACRSMARCEAAAQEVRAAGSAEIVPLELDLSSSASIRAFASAATERIPPTVAGDLVLLNNAGFAPKADTPPTADGLEGAMGAMHVGHHYLTRRLLTEDVRSRVSGAVRVVNVASIAHHLCGLGAALDGWFGEGRSWPMPSLRCLAPTILSDRPWPPSSEVISYSDAKLSNVLHVLELARRMDGQTGKGDKAVEATAIDLGWVETSIQPFMRMPIRLPMLGLMRPSELGVRPIVLAVLGAPGAPPPTPGSGRLMSALGKLVEPLTLHAAEAPLAALAEPLWVMSERICDGWDAEEAAAGGVSS
jgi:NAD(P)-dependent dehydrogenase (short-subunit alcohol dehydrogenase family)